MGLSVWILADPGGITRSVCQVVVARYFPSRIFEQVYGLFYEGSLVLIIFAGAAGMACTEDPIDRRHWANLQTGILGFMLPALAVSILSPEPSRASAFRDVPFRHRLGGLALRPVPAREAEKGRPGLSIQPGDPRRSSRSGVQSRSKTTRRTRPITPAGAGPPAVFFSSGAPNRLPKRARRGARSWSGSPRNRLSGGLTAMITSSFDPFRKGPGRLDLQARGEENSQRAPVEADLGRAADLVEG